MRKVLIAGASGFIGRALINKLLANEDIELRAISREDKNSIHPRLKWVKCDLFSMKDIDRAMEGCEAAYYLVHSMLPSASLSQGTFYDFDLILADNFIRRAKAHNLSHIIYLSGMIPENEKLSWHLRSRFEVENTLRSTTVKTTALRAGLIIGPSGSSFTIIQRLIERLPIMICPKWTNTLSRPTALKDVIKVMIRCLDDKSVQGKIHDIGGPEVITYQGIILKAAKIIRKSRKIFTLNIIPLTVSGFWVTLVTGVPKNLVYPLLLSLKHQMLGSPKQQWPYTEDLSTGVDEALLDALSYENATGFITHNSEDRKVRSIQRLVLPPGRDAEWVASEYFNWLPTFFSTLIKVQIESTRCTFYLINPNIKLLILNKSIERSQSDRQLLYIVGGILAQKTERGRLEFRDVLNDQYVMAAIHEFQPALPWFIYRWTQAIVHLIVMKAFGEHLKWYYICQKRIQT